MWCVRQCNRESNVAIIIESKNQKQTCYALVLLSKGRDHLSDMQVFGLMIATLCHDLEHPGDALSLSLSHPGDAQHLVPIP